MSAQRVEYQGRFFRTRGSAMLLCEQLENRCLLTASLAGGVLTVTGSNAADTIVLSKSGASVKVAIGQGFQLFKAASVTRVVVRGLDGNDTIILGTLDKPGLLDGGAGNDTI